MALKSRFLRILESCYKETAWWVCIFCNFLEFPEQIISRTFVNNCFWAFWYFFSKVFNRLFFWFETICRSLALCEELLLVLKYYFKYVSFMVLIFMVHIIELWMESSILQFPKYYKIGKINPCPYWISTIRE